jgi:hypothetical protein
MLQLYIQTRTWITTRLEAARRDDRGSVTVEQVIITGMVATGAVIAGTALWALIRSGVGRWELW